MLSHPCCVHRELQAPRGVTLMLRTFRGRLSLPYNGYLTCHALCGLHDTLCRQVMGIFGASAYVNNIAIIRSSVQYTEDPNILMLCASVIVMLYGCVIVMFD